MSSKRNRARRIYSSDGAVVGYIEGDTFIKHVQGSRHMLRKPKAWANDDCILEELVEQEVYYLNIFDEESGITYSTSIDNYFAHGFSINRGHGNQTCLPLKYWVITSKSTNPHKKSKKGGD